MWVFALFCAAFFVRMLALWHQGSLWFDEVFSVHFSQMDWGTMMHYLREDVHPPLYAIVLRLWMLVFGSFDLVLRMLSVILGSIGVVTVSLLVCEVYGKKAGIVAGVVSVFAPVLVFSSVEARMYSLLLCLVSVGAMFWFRYLRLEKRSWKDLLAWIVPMSCAALTHLGGAVIFGLLIGCTLLAPELSRREKIMSSVAGVVGLMPFLWWLVQMLGVRADSMMSEWQFQNGIETQHHVVAFFSLLFGVSYWWLVFVFLLGVGCVLMQKQIALTRNAIRAIVICVLYVFVFFFLPNVATKYFLAVSPFLVMIFVRFWLQILESYKEMRLIGFFVFLMISSVFVGSLFAVDARIGWKVLVQNIEAHEQKGDVVVLGWFSSVLPFERYYRGDMAITFIGPILAREKRDLALVRYAGRATFNDEYYDAMQRDLADARRIFVITGGDATHNPLLLRLKHDGWSFDTSQAYGSLTPSLFVLSK
jgi:4-amino-4-deoxy-L-arabinose transferase-like glycosyltransferase